MKRYKKQFFWTRVASILILFLMTAYVPIYANKENKNVLILNSYHKGFTWTDDQTQGITSALKSLNMNYSISVEYMDWKHFPLQENLDKLYDYLAFKYRSKDIDLIVTTDDTALEFALKHRNDIFSHAPIIFSGVNEEGADKLTQDHSQVTGVIEEVNPESILHLALKVVPELKKIYLIYDNSESGLSTGKLTLEAVKAMDPNMGVIPMNEYTYEELIQGIKDIEKDSIVLITTYTMDATERNIDIQDLTRVVSENSKVPVFQLYDFGMGYGVIGGNMQSGRLQGESAGKLALRVLQGEDISRIPIYRNSTYRSIFDYSQLKRFQISLSEVPKGSEIINKPFSFVEKYKRLISFVGAVFVILLIFIYILLVYIRQINKMKGQLQELAYFDSLTGLPNRLSLNKKLLSLAEQKSDFQGTLMFIDCDNFKYINDTLGHAVGDQLIIGIGERIVSHRKDGVMAYRLSGDEFVILLEGTDEEAIVREYAYEILQGFKEPFFIGEHMLQTTISIGIALYPCHAKNTDELLKCADIAMYRAKEEGRNKFVMYDASMNDRIVERMTLEKYLRQAMQLNQFLIYYQPQIDIKTGKIAGFEALLRWNSPELGFVSPQKFIEIAEDTHMIVPLGQWVLEKACMFIKELHKQGYEEYTVSINVSIIQLMQDDFSDNVINTLDKLDLDPRFVELEITESVLAKSFDTICNKLELLRSKGIHIALDDFGKGYSSLNYLKQLPISTLKIDKTFVDGIMSEDSHKSLTGFIVSIGREMGLCVVAEGVETKEQLDYLIESKCSKFQGYLAYKPLSEQDLYGVLMNTKSN